MEIDIELPMVEKNCLPFQHFFQIINKNIFSLSITQNKRKVIDLKNNICGNRAYDSDMYFYSCFQFHDLNFTALTEKYLAYSTMQAHGKLSATRVNILQEDTI